MRKFGRFFIIVLSMVLSLPLTAQDEAVFDSLSIGKQFDYVLKRSNTHEQFKIVRLRHMNKLKKSAQDTVAKLNETISENNNEITTLKDKQQELDTRVSQLNQELDAVTKTKNSMGFLGQEIPKAIYNTVMWGVVLGLAALAFILFFMFKRSNAVTKDTKSRLSEVEDEFEKHRKTALKREQKLARDLMDVKLKSK